MSAASKPKARTLPKRRERRIIARSIGWPFQPLSGGLMPLVHDAPSRFPPRRERPTRGTRLVRHPESDADVRRLEIAALERGLKAARRATAARACERGRR
jgi:hypothetical protein